MFEGACQESVLYTLSWRYHWQLQEKKDVLSSSKVSLGVRTQENVGGSALPQVGANRFLRGKIIVKSEIVRNRTLRVGQMKIRQITQLYLPFTKLVFVFVLFLRQLQCVALPDRPVAQAGFKVTSIFLCQLPKCRDYRHAPLCSAFLSVQYCTNC